MKSHDLLYIRDIIESLSKIEACINGLPEDKFIKSEEKQALVVFNLQIIGEASSKISTELKKKHPDVNWRKLTWMRNFIVHEYFNITPKTVLFTARNDLPGIKKQILEIEKELR